MKPLIEVCMGSSCFSRGNKENLSAIMEFLNDNNLADGVNLELRGSLCQNDCRRGPNIRINGVNYNATNVTDAIGLISKSIKQQ